MMYRPNEIEEKRLLELTKWIENAKGANVYPSFTVKEIERTINYAWEDIDIRKELCEIDFESAKKNLLDKFTHVGLLSDLIKKKISESKNDLSIEVFNYFMEFADEKFEIHFLLEKRLNLLMIESGWLPDLDCFYNSDLEKEANQILQLSFKINDYYLDLIKWIDGLQEDNTIEDKVKVYLKSPFNKRDFVSELYHARNKKDPFSYVKDHIIKKYYDMERLKSQFDFTIKPLKTKEERLAIRKANQTKLFPRQEAFYEVLEEWAKNIVNPCCRDFIVRFLSKGRQLPYHKIPVFKFKNNIEQAKLFLLSQYELKLEKSVLKKQEQKKKDKIINKKLYKSHLRFLKKQSKESGRIDFTEDIGRQTKASSSKVTTYNSGYDGTWAHDEAGWSDDDIDTVLDGEPDAYWNID